MMKYLIDSNFFIQAYRSSYPLDVAKGFWKKVKSLADNGVIASIDKVRDEVYSNEDDLKKWCQTDLSDKFFLDFTSKAMGEYAKICSWAQNNKQYTQNAKNVFMDEKRADAFWVAFASTDNKNFTIVTQEVSAPNSKTNIKLPDACKVNDVRCLNIIDMFREIGETF